MKKYILNLIDDAIKNYESVIKDAEKRIESGNYDVESNNKIIRVTKLKILETKKHRDKFIKTI